MTISVSDIGTAGGTSSATLTISATVPSGALIVVCVADRNATIGSQAVSDPVNGSYGAPIATKLGGTNIFASIYCFPNSGALSAQNITIHTASSSSCGITAFYATGAATSPVDSTVTASGSSSAGGGITVTSGTPSQAGDLFVTMAAFNPGSGSTSSLISQPVGWSNPPDLAGSTIPAASGTDRWVYGGNLLNAGTGTETWTPAVSGTVNGWAAIVVGFKVASSPPPTNTNIPTLLLMGVG